MVNIFTAGAAASAVKVDGAGTTTLNGRNYLTTSGDKAHGIEVYAAASSKGSEEKAAQVKVGSDSTVYTQGNQSHGVYTDMLDAPNHAKFSEAMGFIFDSAPVYDQMAACTTVVAEYRDALLYGLVDVDSYLEKFNEELKAAGIDEIIAEEQKQFDAWLAAQ